jgi:hypothetical protein
VTGRRGRRCKQLQDDLKKTREPWKLKKETLDCIRWVTSFGIVYVPVARKTENV